MYKGSLSLLTDLYQLTMSYGYFKSGMKDTTAVFNLFYRKNPFKGNYAIACGLHSVIDFIKNFSFEEDDIEYLRSLKGNDQKLLFNEDFLTYLSELKFEGDIDAVEEGRVVFPHEPLLRIKAPVILCQLLETPLLNIINFQTLIATKANRVVNSAQGDPVLEFGLRRAQGIDGSLSASYGSVVGGIKSTSNVLAGKLYGMEVKGTHAHSWVMSYDTEDEAFETYAKAMPNNCIFLVDTYNTVNGVTKAIECGLRLREKGYEMMGIRLDSGDLADLSIKARKMLDEAGFPDARIVASNDLDENKIAELKSNGAKIDVWGIGTKLVTCHDQPALGGVYKLSAIKKNGAWDYKVKKSEELIKVSNPGIINIYRYSDSDSFKFDLLVNEEYGESGIYVDAENSQENIIENHLTKEQLLKPIFKNGALVYEKPSLEEIDNKRNNDLYKLPKELKNNHKASLGYKVNLEKKLHELKISLLSQKR
jgi:nicotinate phosphoribosyltransferase